MGIYKFRTLLIVIFLFSQFKSFGQCEINNRGINSNVKKNQYPYTVFYRNDPTGAFNFQTDSITALSNYRKSLREMVRDGKGLDPKDLMAEVPFETYKALFDLAFNPIVDYKVLVRIDLNDTLTALDDDTVYSHVEDRGRNEFAKQLKAK